MELINLPEYEEAARAKMSESFFGFYADGAADEITLRANRSVFDSMRLRPRVLRDVSRRSSDTKILGRSLKMPVVIAPAAMAKFSSMGRSGRPG